MPDLYGSRQLTPKELRIVELVTQGMTNKEIADEMGFVRDHVANCIRVIFDKTGMSTRLELALWNVVKEAGAK